MPPTSLLRAPRALALAAQSRRRASVFRRSLLRAVGAGGPAPPPPAPGEPRAPPPLSLFRQESLPAALRLPRPAEPLARVGAGLADAALALAGGAAAGALGAALGAPPEVAFAATQGGAVALFCLRDAFGDGGNRSVGKALFGLEVALWDGALAPPAACAARSAYLALAPLAGAHHLLGAALEVALFFDLASLALTPDARKAGDYVFGTRVVEERPGRAGRLRDLSEALEREALRADIEALAPGLLASRAAAAAAAEAATTAVAAGNSAAATSNAGFAAAIAAVGGGGGGGGGGVLPAAAGAAGPAAAAAAAAAVQPLAGFFSEVRGQDELGGGGGGSSKVDAVSSAKLNVQELGSEVKR